MRIAFVTDLHVRDEEIGLHRRLLADTLEIIREGSPDLILVGGDLTGWRVPHRASVDERNALVGFFRQCAALATVVICRGNHDFPKDWAFLEGFPNVNYIETPTVIEIGRDFDLSVWPWIDRGRFPPGSDYQAEVEALYSRTIGELRPGARRLLLGHIAAATALLREGQPVVPTEDPIIDVARLAPDVSAGFLGHYHFAQEVCPNVRYGGGLFLNNYGEGGFHGVTFWDDSIGFELAPLPQPRRHVFTVELDGHHPIQGVAPGDFVKFRFQVPDRAKLHEAKAQAQSLVDRLPAGCTSRVIFEVEQAPVTRIGAEVLAAQATTAGKFHVWLASQGIEPSSITEEALHILDKIEVAIATGGKTL